MPNPPKIDPTLKPWPADSVERWALDRIKPYPKNARVHSDEQVAQIAESMKRFGVTTPLLVDEEGVLLFGHGRRRAAELLGYTEMPVTIARGWTDDEKRAYRILDNSASDASSWDLPLLKVEFAALQSSGLTALIGFSDKQLQKWDLLAPGPPAENPDAIPDVPAKPIPVAGDVWILGRHRLIVGDATLPETWKRLCGTERAAMVFTDPPYGVSYAARGGKFDVIEGDEKRRDELYKMLVKSLQCMAGQVVDTGAMYVWHASSTREDFAQAMKAAGMFERQYLIWVKPSPVFGRADYQWAHEPCFYASKGDRTPAYYGERTESTVWHVQMAATKDVAATIGNGVLVLDGAGASLFVQSKPPKNKKLRQIRITKGASVYLSGSDRQDTTVWEVARDGGAEHPTQKPVELARRAIENSSRPGEIVLDGFLGSGTTLIGAELTARRAFGCEIDPAYAEVIIRRWERVSGQKAVLDGSGASLEHAAKMRQVENLEAFKGTKNTEPGHANGDAQSDPREPVRSKDAGGTGGERGVRAPVHARRAPARRKPASKSPALAGNT